MRLIVGIDPFYQSLARHGITRPDQLPKGKIVGLVTLETCIPTEELELDIARTSEQKYGDFRPGRWAWKVSNPIVFPEPIAYQGKIVANIRTDLDAFSPLEISCLIRHGYCIGRMACRSRADLFGTDLPSNPPWDPISPASIPQSMSLASRVDGSIGETTRATFRARKLQDSASRRIWSRLLSLRDWTSFIYVPILALMLLAPYFMFNSYQHSQRVARLIKSIAHGGPDFDIMSQLIAGPMNTFKGEFAQDVRQLEPSDYKGFDILQDLDVIDLRSWNPNSAGKSESTSLVYGYRRLKVQKAATSGKDDFRIIPIVSDPDSQFRFPPQQFHPKLRRMVVENPNALERTAQFEVSVDLSKVPTGQIADVLYEHHSPGDFVQRGDISTTIAFRSEFDAADMTRWILMPRGREFRRFQIVRYEIGKPGTAEVVQGFTQYLADDSNIIAYKMASVKAGHMFEVTWFYK